MFIFYIMSQNQDQQSSSASSAEETSTKSFDEQAHEWKEKLMTTFHMFENAVAVLKSMIISLDAVPSNQPLTVEGLTQRTTVCMLVESFYAKATETLLEYREAEACMKPHVKDLDICHILHEFLSVTVGQLRVMSWCLNRHYTSSGSIFPGHVRLGESRVVSTLPE